MSSKRSRSETPSPERKSSNEVERVLCGARLPKVFASIGTAGGVGKTTNILNLAHMFVQRDKDCRVLLVDCCTERALTQSLCKEARGKFDLECGDLYEALQPALSMQTYADFRPANVVDFGTGICLLPGSVRLEEHREALARARGFMNTDFFGSYNAYFGCFRAVVLATALANKCTMVMLDLPAGYDCFNMVALMSSDYALVSCTACPTTLFNLCTMERVFSEWAVMQRKLSEATDGLGYLRFKASPPRFLGFINTRRMELPLGATSKTAQSWFQSIQSRLDDFFKVLHGVDMHPGGPFGLWEAPYCPCLVRVSYHQSVPMFGIEGVRECERESALKAFEKIRMDVLGAM